MDKVGKNDIFQSHTMSSSDVHVHQSILSFKKAGMLGNILMYWKRKATMMVSEIFDVVEEKKIVNILINPFSKIVMR